MAFQKTVVVSKFGAPITVAGAYISLQNICIQQVADVVRDSEGHPVIGADGTTTKEIFWNIGALALIYTGKQAKLDLLEPVDQVGITVRYDIATGLNPHAYLYAELAKLPQFADAEFV